MPNHNQTIEVNAVENGKQPKDIVILFGWLGSQPKHVQKYALLYQDRQCSTIHGTAEVVPIMLAQTYELQSFALEVAREACKLLKANASEDQSSIPVIVHAFSGAGCIVLEQLELLITKAKEGKASNTATSQQDDLILLGEAMQRGGQIFDSAPAYLSTRTGLTAIWLAVPNLILRLLIQSFYLLFALFQWAVDMDRAEIHWCHFQVSAAAHRQAYIYSSADQATDSAKLEELIVYRQQKTETTIFVQKFTDSSHCAHLIKFPKEYKAFLTSFFESIEEQQKEKELLDQDPIMTDYQMEMD